ITYSTFLIALEPYIKEDKIIEATTQFDKRTKFEAKGSELLLISEVKKTLTEQLLLMKKIDDLDSSDVLLSLEKFGQSQDNLTLLKKIILRFTDLKLTDLGIEDIKKISSQIVILKSKYLFENSIIKESIDKIALSLAEQIRLDILTLFTEKKYKAIERSFKESESIAINYLQGEKLLEYYYTLHAVLHENLGNENIKTGVYKSLIEKENYYVPDDNILEFFTNQNNNIYYALIAFCFVPVDHFNQQTIFELSKELITRLNKDPIELLTLQKLYTFIGYGIKNALNNLEHQLIKERLQYYIDGLFIELKGIITSDVDNTKIKKLYQINHFLKAYDQSTTLLEAMFAYWKESKTLYILFNPIEKSLFKHITDEEITTGETSSIIRTKSPNIWQEYLKDRYFTKVQEALLNEKEAFPESIQVEYGSNIAKLKNSNKISEVIKFSKILKMHFPEEANIAQIDQLLNFKLQFISSHSLADEKNDVLYWIECIEHLITIKDQLTLEELTQILISMQSFESLEIALTVMKKASQERNNVAHEMLLQQMKKAIVTTVSEPQELERFFQKDLLLKQPLFDSKAGREVILLLSKELFTLADEGKKDVKIEELKKIINLLIEARVYQNFELIQKIQYKPISFWPSVLKRQIFLDYFEIRNVDEEFQASFTDCLLMIEKEHGKQIILDLAKLFHNIKGPVNLSKLYLVLKKFSSHKLPLNDRVINELKKENTLNDWIKCLNDPKIMGDKNSIIRDEKEITSIMRDDKTGINLQSGDNLITVIDQNVFTKYHMQDFLHSKYEEIGQILSGKSLLEYYISLIKTQYKETLKPLEEVQAKEIIKQFTERFKKLGPEKFKEPTLIIEFLSIIMKAAKISEGYEPRETQLAAIIFFLDGMAKLKGRLANIATGEGKSLITRILAIARVLNGEKVDILTSSSELAKRDAEEATKLFDLFGINVGNNCDEACNASEQVRKTRYDNCQVIYGEVGAFQRDYLLSKYMERDIRPNLHGNS
ncbi:MAG: hypothetical protein WCP46_06835, partial [Alphaproteobacteria bacterium]